MGQSSSKSINSVFNEVRREYEEKSVSSCQGSGRVLNRLRLTDIKGNINLGDITQENALEMDISCLSDMMTSLTYNDEMRTKLMASAKTKDDRLFKLFENNKSETQNITKNLVSEYTKVVKEQLAESLATGENIIELERADGTVTIGNIVQKNKIQNIFDNAATSKNVVEAVTKLETASKGDTSTESTFTETFLTGITGKARALVPLVLALAVLAAIIAFVVYMVKKPPAAGAGFGGAGASSGGFGGY